MVAFKTNHCSVEAEVLEGDPRTLIVSYAQQRKADYIVIGARGMGGVVTDMGSVSKHILHHSGVPVICVRAKVGQKLEDVIFKPQGSKPRTWLVAVDGSESARMACNRAAELAQGSRSDKVVLVTVIPRRVMFGPAAEVADRGKGSSKIS